MYILFAPSIVAILFMGSIEIVQHLRGAGKSDL